MVEDWGDLIKQMKLDMKKDEVRCYRSMRANFDGTFMLDGTFILYYNNITNHGYVISKYIE